MSVVATRTRAPKRRPPLAQVASLEAAVNAPLGKRSLGPKGRAVVAALGLMVTAGIAAWMFQVRSGLRVTGLRDQVVWGLYITTFVFFIGISMAGTLISAILRLTGAEWRRPITRIAEAVTVASLLVAGAMIIVDMGRPERLLSVPFRANLRSPIVWDVIAISTYLFGSILYLYLALVPDIASLRRHPGIGGLRRRLYRALSLGWTGSPGQREHLERATKMMAVAIIPVAVAVHSVTAWIFGMTLREGWNSTIMAPYFVIAALYSGTAVIIIVLAIVRRALRLDAFITHRHFSSLGVMTLVFGILYAYFTLSEFLTMGFKLREGDEALLHHLVSGPFAWTFWTTMLVGTAAPLSVLAFRRARTTAIVVSASSLIVAGMLLKRYLIVVPPLSLPLMPTGWAVYKPSLVELTITAAAFGGFALLLILFSKAFPLVSVSEVREGLHAGAHGTSWSSVDPVNADGRRARKRGPKRALAVLLLASVLVVGIGVLGSAGRGHEQPAAAPVRLQVLLRDRNGRKVPGALIQLRATIPFFGKKRPALIDEARTDAAGFARLSYSPAEAGRFHGTVTFAGAAIWAPTRADVVFDVRNASYTRRTDPFELKLPWARRWLILLPVLVVWAVFLIVVRRTLKIRENDRA